MSATIEGPCFDLPRIPEVTGIPGLSLIGGAALKGFLDLSLGAPTDCKLTFNLLLQLAPLLASLTCILKIFDVFVTLEKFAEAAKNPVTDLPGAVPAVLDAIKELKKCIPIPGLDLYLMIKGILNLVLSFLSCFIGQLESILQFQATIDPDAAGDNPVLRDTLLCVQANAKTSLDNLMLAAQPLQPILGMTKTLIGVANLKVALPDLSSLSASGDATQALASLNQAVDALKGAITAIP